MATYNSFEDLPVWQEAKKLAVNIYKQTAQEIKLNKDFGLRGQIQRAAVSITSNIAEGFERGSKREFIQFLYIAKGSCGELRSQIHIAKDIGYFNMTKFKELYNLSLKINRQINGLIEYLKSSPGKGQKYK